MVVFMLWVSKLQSQHNIYSVGWVTDSVTVIVTKPYQSNFHVISLIWYFTDVVVQWGLNQTLPSTRAKCLNGSKLSVLNTGISTYGGPNYRGSTVFFSQSYRCDVSKLHPDLARCFVQLQHDEETKAFLESSRRKCSNLCLQVFYALVQLLLSLFLSQTAING